MKINEIITEKYVKRGPEEDQMAQAEFNLLKRADPDFADKFMNAYNEFGSVDAAYEKARRETQDDLARKKRQLKKPSAKAKFAKKDVDQSIARVVGKTGKRGGQFGNQNARKQPSGVDTGRGSFDPSKNLDPEDRIDLFKDPAKIFTTMSPFSAGLELGDRISDRILGDTPSPDDSTFIGNMIARSKNKRLQTK